MCSRYCLTGGEQLELPLPEDFTPRFNVAPTHVMPVVVERNGELWPRYMVWGMKPFWAKALLINARSETLLEKPTFRGSLKSRRVVIPATGYFEWHEVEGKKHPLFIHRPDGLMLGFCGLYMTSEETGAQEFMILTTAAPETTMHRHDRMPSILPLGSVREFLFGDMFEAQALAEASIPAAELTSFPVHPRMSNPRYESPDVIQSLA